MNWAHKLDAGPRSSVMFWWQKIHSNWHGRITASHIPQLLNFQCQTYPNPYLRNWLLSGIRHTSRCNFPCHLQVKPDWNDFKHFPSTKQNHPPVKLCCLRHNSLEDAPGTLFHPVTATHGYATFPFPFYMCCCYCAARFTCNTTGLLRVFTSRRQFPYSFLFLIPSAWEEREKKPKQYWQEEKDLEKHSSFPSRRVSGISLLYRGFGQLHICKRLS